MTVESIKKALQELAFLQDFSDEQLDQLRDIARLVSFPEGTVIFHKGDSAEQVYLLISGTVAVEICAPVIGCSRILTVGGGDLLGWSSVLSRVQFTASARALTAAEAIELSSKRLQDLCESNPRFGYRFMRQTALALASRLSATRLQLLDVFAAEAESTGTNTDAPSGHPRDDP